MAFGVVLDSNVLFPFSLADLLLRCAEREVYDLYWSERILEELERNLVEERGLTSQQATYRLERMRQTFPAATVPADQITRLELAMTNDPKDRHVLAAAVASPAEAVVTFNLVDFPQQACDPHDVDALHPDEFVLGLIDLAPDVVRDILRAQAAALQRPPLSVRDLLDVLRVAGIPEAAGRLRDLGE